MSVMIQSLYDACKTAKDAESCANAVDDLFGSAACAGKSESTCEIDTAANASNAAVDHYMKANPVAAPEVKKAEAEPKKAAEPKAPNASLHGVMVELSGIGGSNIETTNAFKDSPMAISGGLGTDSAPFGLGFKLGYLGQFGAGKVGVWNVGVYGFAEVHFPTEIKDDYGNKHRANVFGKFGGGFKPSFGFNLNRPENPMAAHRINVGVPFEIGRSQSEQDIVGGDPTMVSLSYNFFRVGGELSYSIPVNDDGTVRIELGANVMCAPVTGDDWGESSKDLGLGLKSNASHNVINVAAFIRLLFGK